MATTRTCVYGGFLSSPLPSPVVLNIDTETSIRLFPLAECKGRHKSDIAAHVSSIHQTIQKLHQEIKLGHDKQAELDRYIIVSGLIELKHPVLTSETIQYFVLQPQHVFGLNDLPDIGKDIRELFYPHKHKNLILYLIEYSLPYIKHNRLSLPNMTSIDRTSILNFVRIILGCLLGIFPHCKRRPIWSVRVGVFRFFHDLITTSTDAKLYDFCDKNIPLLRISIIEYFVFFIQRNMPIEAQLQESFVKDCSVSMTTMYGNILFITDTFRQSCLQKQFDIDAITASAILAVERLNRLCKGKTARLKRNNKENQQIFCNYFSKCSEDKINTILNLPLIRHCAYTLRLQKDLQDLDAIMYAKMFQQCIKIYSLPQNIVLQQHEVVTRNFLKKGTLGLQCMYIHVCFLCSSQKNSNHTIRFNNENNGVTCDCCKQSNYILKINLVGRILRMFDTHYYFCSFCCKIHTWRYDGSEYYQCPLASKPDITDTKKRCLLCEKTQCDTVRVCDDRIGVMQDVHLCRWHMPYDHMLKFLNNLDDLFEAIVSKTSKKNRLK